MQKIQKAIEVIGLKRSFKSLLVLDGINFSVNRGEILALLGPNGAGKTTTIKILSTLLLPDSGEAKVNGFDVVQQAKNVRRSIGLTGQYAAVDEYLTGKENLEMIGRLYRLSKDEAAKRAEELLRRLDLSESENRPVRTYSGGMRRRIDLAMSLIASPPVIFLDEPTTGLDPRSRITMWEIIRELASTDITILLTTQYMEEADNLSDRIVVIDKGKVIDEGTPAQLKSKVGSDHLEFVISVESSFEKAVQAVSVKDLRMDKENRSISVPTKNGAEDLKKILELLENSRIKIEEISLRQPTLDDVFLSLTGHAAETQK
jgi:ABC-2 type transport system ATP-binding protein